MGKTHHNKEERVYSTILVPLDGSETAEAVLDLAKNLAVRSGAALTLLHVCAPDQASYERMHAAYIERMADTIQRDIAKTCTTVECHFDGVQATATPVLAKGDPADEIVRYAQEKKVSVILMATHGRSKVRSTVSDIANRVVRSSTVPVWLLRTLGPNEIVCTEWPPKRVMVPLDGSEKAEKVLPYATEYAELLDAELVLLRVCEAPFITADYPEASMPITWDEHVKQVRSLYESQCSVYLETVKDRLEGTGLKISVVSLLGNAADEIVGYIEKNRCDLVAMTAHGRSALARSPIARWAFSNVTEQVLAATSRGILVAKGQ